MSIQTHSNETRTTRPGGTWIEVRTGAILRNLEQVRGKIAPFTRVMAVIKANAYGHGLVAVGRELQGKVDFLGIGSLKEASLLREQGITAPLFLFGRLFDEEIPLALQMNLTATVSSLEEAEAFSSVAGTLSKKATVHVKVDTGMGRLGIRQAEALDEIERMASLPNLQLEGIYTHFPTAEKYPDAFTTQALAQFEKLIEDLRREGISFTLRHAANSAGALRFKSHVLNLVRPGIALYGIYPDSSFQGEIDLEAALTLKSRVLFVKRVAPGDSVGYGREFVAQTPTTIAVLPAGYAHGYPFQLSNKAEVLCRGRRFRLAGRVCMDSLMIDLGNTSDVRAGDEVTLLGSSGDEEIRAEDLAKQAHTIAYDIVTRLEAGIPRIYR